MYTESINRPDQPHFPSTFKPNKAIPFGRSSAFTNDIRDSATYTMDAHENSGR